MKKRIPFLLLVIAFISSCSHFSGDYATQIKTKEQINQPSWTDTPKSTETPRTTPTPIWSDEYLILGLSSPLNELGEGIVLYHLATGKSELILEKGYSLLDFSPSGDQLLIYDMNALYLLYLDSLEKTAISENLYVTEFGQANAYWLKDINKIAYVGQSSSHFLLILFDPSSGEFKELLKTDNELRIRPSFEGIGLYWDERNDASSTNYISYDGEITVSEYARGSINAAPSGDRYIEDVYLYEDWKDALIVCKFKMRKNQNFKYLVQNVLSNSLEILGLILRKTLGFQLMILIGLLMAKCYFQQLQLLMTTITQFI